nr:von Willebrand factor type A domain-containing protein [Gemmatimonadaceae bacterium]
MSLLSTLVGLVLSPSPAPSPPAHVVVRADSFVVTGTITRDQPRQPIAGATISVDGSSVNARSEADGRYRLGIARAPGLAAVTLRVRALGFAAATKLVAITAKPATVDFTLAASNSALSPTVVNAAKSREMERRERAADVAAPMPMRGMGMPGGTSMAPPPFDRRVRRPSEPFNREQYAAIAENPFLAVGRNPLSTFAIDVDRASYANVRRFLENGARPPRDAVRIEELVNYFHYDYHAPPRGGAPLDVTVETHVAPWQSAHRLVRIGMQAQRLPIAELPPANLVFLVDVSGSMQDPNKLPLVKQSLRLLTQELRPQDRVAIAVYAGAAGLVLPSTSGRQKERILEALDRLEAGGSTNGAAGIRLAYQTARAHLLEDGANRVILATDGDFNVGTTSDSELIQLIERERKSGVHLTVLGFGMGNLQDAKMEQLADKGNGQYAYIDNLAEAQKALVREMGGTLFTLAKDVKIQVEFNPARVRAYRLLGYENRLLRDEDFNDDTKDAGELGASHSVTALYEVVLADVESPVRIGSVDPLRYETPRERVAAPRGGSDELAFVKVRYQPPRGGASALLSYPVRETRGAPSVDYSFASAVAGFGLLLRDTEH